MFSQPPDPDDDQSKTLQNNPRRRKVKLFKNKNKRKGNKKKPFNKKQSPQTHFAPLTMSAWAESFTHAATWQMKQQLAYWKSRATALEYENGILHDIIRKNYMNDSITEGIEGNNRNVEEHIVNMESESSQEEEENEDEFEVSEEYIQFLMNNAKYKEDAKRERERLKASQNTEQLKMEEMEATPTKSTENKEEQLRNLYGKDWERIAALEMSVQSHFLDSSDQDKPEYWPNIPLNFNY